MRYALPFAFALVLIAPVPSLAATKKTGKLVYHNKTTSRIRVTVTQLVYGDGSRVNKNAYWDLAPGARTTLLLNGKPIVCHQFHYRLTTTEGTSAWTGTCKTTTFTGRFVLALDNKLLATHRGLAKGEKLKRALARVRVRNTTGRKATVSCRYYLDADGKSRNVKGGSWTIGANSNAYLDDLRKPLYVSRFEFTLQTPEGKSNWSLTAPNKGDIVFELNSAFLNRHRVALGLKPTTPPIGTVSKAAKERATAKIIGAFVAHAAATNKKAENLGEVLVQQAALKVRDGLIESALKDVFPTRSRREIAAGRRVIALALDGKLNIARLREETAKEELLRALKKANPDAGAAAEFADFIYGVSKAMKR